MTVDEIITIAEISQYMSSNAIDGGGLYGGGEDLLLPRKLYCIRKNVEWLNDLDSSDDTLFATSRYLYALCGKYKFKAAAISGTGGSVSPVIPDTSDCSAGLTVTAVDFQSDGKTYFNANLNGKQLLIFWNNINRFIQQPEFQYVAGGGFKMLLPTDFDTNGANSDAVFVVIAGCTSAGSLFIPNPYPINTVIDVTGVDDYYLTWTAQYAAIYGKGSFQVYQSTDGSLYQPTGILPLSDDGNNPTLYAFTGLGNLDTRIIIS